jgi:hypothetical protein
MQKLDVEIHRLEAFAGLKHDMTRGNHEHTAGGADQQLERKASEGIATSIGQRTHFSVADESHGADELEADQVLKGDSANQRRDRCCGGQLADAKAQSVLRSQLSTLAAELEDQTPTPDGAPPDELRSFERTNNQARRPSKGLCAAARRHG